MNLRLTEAAEADLVEIWAYLAFEASENVASRLVSDIQADLDRLTAYPFLGASRANLAPGLRMKAHGAYAIYYLARDRDLIVVRVLHAARDAVAIHDAGGLEG